MVNRALTIIFLCIGSFYLGNKPAFAGYAEMKPPSGWNAGTGAGARFAAGAANEATFTSMGVTARASMTASGRTVTMPAAMRFAANASRFAAGRFFNPTAMAFAAIPIVATWAVDYGVQLCNEGGTQFWCSAPPPTDGYEYSHDGIKWQSSATGAAKDGVARSNGPGAGFKYTFKSLKYPTNGRPPAIGYTATQSFISNGQFAGEVSGSLSSRLAPPTQEAPRRLSQEEFENALAPAPMTPAVAQIVPDGVPVQTPVLNPNANGKPSTLTVPMGEPVPVPNTNPQAYSRPAINVKPANTPEQPWLVDVQPVDQTVPEPAPDPNAPEPDPTKPPEKPREGGLCDLFPGILACEKLGNAEAPTPIQNTDKPLTINKDDGFGPQDGQCPAAKPLNILGISNLAFEWTPFCGFANGIRPFVIGFAYLSAALTFFGLGRKGD